MSGTESSTIPTPQPTLPNQISASLRADLVKLIMQVIISLGLITAGVFILIYFDAQSNPEVTSAAAGWIGIVIGYWLK